MSDVVFYPSATSGPQGPQGDPGASAYAQAVDAGFEGTLAEWLESLRGEPGPQGEPGLAGSDGAPGSPGADGAPGADGSSAYEVAVANGFTGSEADWLDSLRGQDGAPGADGIDGADGPSAYEVALANGFAGTESEWLSSLVGPAGLDGSDGAPGSPGADGASAYELAVANGFTGTESEWLVSLIGPQGEPGPAGSDGLPGQDGAPGSPGADGADGASAYEVALANGFVGTEAQWLESLVGPQGDPGVAGSDGQDGLSAYEVAVANGFTGAEADWLASLQGAEGAPGSPGADGADGASAYEIAVANGFVGTESEWLVSLEGTDGAPGEPGAPGSDGNDGASAYEVAVTNGFVGTEAEWLTSLIGPAGADGAHGVDGIDGVGVPAGGSAGQVLSKIDGTDYNTEWVTASSGSSSLDSLTDVTVDTPQWDQILKYNGDTMQWENGYAGPARQVVIDGFNPDTVAPIAAGSVVYVSGRDTSSPWTPPYIAVATNTAALGGASIGVVPSEVGPENGTNVVIAGTVFGVDTSAFSDGDTVWLGVDGALTDTMPTSATSIVKVGTVLVADATDGQLLVDVDVFTAGPAGAPGADGVDGVDGQDASSVAPPPTTNTIEVPPRWFLQNSAVGSTAATIYGSCFVAPDARTVSTIYYYISTWATSAVSLWRVGLYRLTNEATNEWTLLAASANDTTKPTGLVEKTLDASVTLVPGAVYAIATVVSFGSGAPSFFRVGVLQASMQNHGTPIAWDKSSTSDLPTTIIPSKGGTVYGCGVK